MELGLVLRRGGVCRLREEAGAVSGPKDRLWALRRDRDGGRVRPMGLGRGPQLGFLNSALRLRGNLAEPEAAVASLVFVEVGRGGSKRGFPFPCTPCL